MISANTAAKLTFLPVLFDSSLLLLWFPLCCRKCCYHSPCVFLLYSRIIHCLPAIEVTVPGLSLLSPSFLPYIFVPNFLNTFLYLLLTFHFLHSFGPLCCPVYLVSMYEVPNWLVCQMNWSNMIVSAVLLNFTFRNWYIHIQL